MAKNERAIGSTRRVGPFATSLKSGDLLIHNGWAGVVQKDIRGTTEPETTIDGRPVKDLSGDGMGDIQLEGVFKFLDENGAADPLADGDLVELASPKGVRRFGVVPRPPGLMGPQTVGHVLGAPYVDDGIRYVDVKLLGRPGL